MVDKTRKHIPDEINGFDEPETATVSTADARPPSSRRSPSNSKIKLDELIVLLSDAYENKRARQVFEWEATRRKSFQKAA